MPPVYFFIYNVPALLLLAGAVVFAGISARRRKEHAVLLLFIGLAVQLAGMMCSQAGVFFLSVGKTVTSTDRTFAMAVVTGLGRFISLAGGIVTLVAWILFARNRPDVGANPGRVPPPVPPQAQV